MDPWMERVFAGKEAMRKKLARAPVEEKIRMLELMRDRELVIRKVRERWRAELEASRAAAESQRQPGDSSPSPGDQAPAPP
jgi:hypothetical protein